jgi:hypothetical protein
VLTHKMPKGLELTIPDGDVDILRGLAERIAAIAALPEQAERKELWRRVNGLEKPRPAVLIRMDEVPWHEVDGGGAPAVKTTTGFAQAHEREFRRILYQWEHMACDMVVEPVVYSLMALTDTGCGIQAEEDLLPQSEKGSVFSHRYKPQIRDEKDLDKIQAPRLSHREDITEGVCELRREIFGDILEVRKRGINQGFFFPWDELVTWWGPEQALLDLIEKPALVREAMERLTRAYLSRIDQWEELSLFTLEEGNFSAGSGGLAYTDALPGPDADLGHLTARNLWGYSTAQIFTGVSPRMHEEFSLRYERRLLERFGLNYYGCCEALHHKVDLLRSIPNLRKISMSPWADIEKGVESVGNDYVLSIKPSPAVFARAWSRERVRQELEQIVARTRGCSVEIVMKDITTVNHHPERLREWAEIAMSVVTGSG